MGTGLEVGVYSDLNTENYCFKIFDLQSGLELRTFKEGLAGRHCLSMCHPNYFITGLNEKQIIHCWDKFKEQLAKKIVCPGKVNSLALSPDGNYCVVGLAEKIYVWQIPTGNLMAVLSKHYQPVTCLKFVDTGTHFLSGGDDGIAITWNFAGIFTSSMDSTEKSKSLQTLHTWSHHSLPVTDIYTGCGGIRCRVVTASLDQTCKLYDLSSGNLICSLIFDHGITSVTMDLGEYRLFAGSIFGPITVVTLLKSGISKEHYIKSGEENTDLHNIMEGHSKQITSLAVTMDGCTLLSGSMDGSCRLWHIESGQCVRTISCRGPVTNALIIRTPHQISQPLPQNKTQQPIGNFQRTVFTPDTLTGTSVQSESGDVQSSVPVLLKDIDWDTMMTSFRPIGLEAQDATERNLLLDIIHEFTKSANPKLRANNSMSVTEMKERLQILEQENKELREFVATRLVERLINEENDKLEAL